MTVRTLFLGAVALVVLAAAAAVPRAASGQESPDETLKSFELAEGLEATVWATEPMLVNPTNIDVDARGRVWVLEGANYRGTVTRPEGDRILILEDTDGDGKADSQKVFAQDPMLASPLGIAVLGDKVYVSLSPNVWVYTIDETGDKPVGKPELWMTGFEGVNHDHGVHAIVFGPDGRFYFNAGNDGCGAKEPFKLGPAGKPVVDVTGSDVPRGTKWRGAERPKGVLGYQQGMAFRCNPDGSGFEVLGHNFRNNYELAPDSFGTVWQSDNDDDGNESTRLNFVMEGGDFGFHGPKGYDWNRDKAAFPDQSRQEAHWHQRWPGVVPNMVNTGGGSPTGIVVYEGELLPDKFRGALIHCDPGPNVVRAFIPRRSAQVAVKKFDEPDAMKGPDREGAGYTVDVVTLLRGKDRWFRPSDVCVAPDGSLLISDWYDPGVGGHQTADQPKDQKPDWQKLRGRIYRVAPNGNKPVVVKHDLSTVPGQIAALKSPNVATRYLAVQNLKGAKDAAAAESALAELFKSNEAPRYRARALWRLAAGPNAAAHINASLGDKDVDLVLAGLRAARLAGMDMIGIANRTLASSPSPAVLRELAVAMNYQPAEKSVPVLMQLANQFDGEDRWYLEALGIGATGKEQALLDAWEKSGTNKDGEAGELIRWRLKKELPAQARLDDKAQLIPSWWAIGPFDGLAKNSFDDDLGPAATPTAIDTTQPLEGLDGKPVRWEHVAATPFDGAVAGLRWFDAEAYAATRGFRAERVHFYLAATVVSPVEQPAKLLVGSNDGCHVWLNGTRVLKTKANRAMDFPNDTLDVSLKRGANVLMVKLRNSYAQGGLVVALAPGQQKLTTSNDPPAANAAEAVASASSGSPAGAKPTAMLAKGGSPLPPIDALAKLAGDAKSGEEVFADAAGAKCASCHQIGVTGEMLGPPLSTIGQKLSKAQLYEAILTPSSGILMGFENWVVRTKSGQLVSGLKTSETPDGLTIKDTQGKYHDLAADEIAKQAKQKVSIMPENLSETMTQQELVDLVEYLSTLRNK